MGVHPLETRPKTVALVALGPSYRDFVGSRINKKNSQRYDEIWVVNSGLEVFKADKIWLMDDLRMMQHRYPSWAERMKTETTPIITCKEYPEYPAAVAYPIEEVIANIRDDWFSNTVAYAIAYATMIKVEELFIFGADFMYPGHHVVEPGADCCAYLLGIAKERGVHWKLPQSTTLLDSHLCQVVDGNKMQRPLYGYDYNPGDCRAKVERGTANELETILARKAPYKTQEISHGAQPPIARVDEGQQDRPSRDRQSEPLRGLGDAGRPADLSAGRQGVLRGWHRDTAVGAAELGVRGNIQNVSLHAKEHRVDGTGDGASGGEHRIELTLGSDRGFDGDVLGR